MVGSVSSALWDGKSVIVAGNSRRFVVSAGRRQTKSYAAGLRFTLSPQLMCLDADVSDADKDVDSTSSPSMVHVR